jgi:hypothetical protein
MMHGEVLLRDSIGALQGGYRVKMNLDPNFADFSLLTMKENPEKFLNEYLFDFQGKQSVGFKFKWDESLDIHWQRYTKLIAEDREIKVIHLIRRNLLHQFISYIAVNERGMPTLIRRAEEARTIEPFEVKLESFKAFCENYTRKEEESKDLYKNHRNFSVLYEDIVDENSKSLKELQEFIGVFPTNLEHGTRKNIESSETQVINFEELNSWYGKSQYAIGF